MLFVKTMNDFFPLQPLPFAPIIRFNSDGPAMEYISRRMADQDQLLLKAGELGKAALVSNKLHLASMFTSLLSTMASENEYYRPFTDHGRWSNERRPITFPKKKMLGGGTPVLLLADGPQMFYRPFDPLPRRLSLLEELISGPRNCYIAWDTDPDKTFRHSGAPNHCFSIRRKARGVCVWQECTYNTHDEEIIVSGDEETKFQSPRDIPADWKAKVAEVILADGKVNGFQTVFASLDFAIEEKEAHSRKATGNSRAHLIEKVRFWERRWSPNSGIPIESTKSTYMDLLDRKLFERAIGGFLEHCSPHHRSYEAWQENTVVPFDTPETDEDPHLDAHDLLKDAYRAFVNTDLILTGGWGNALKKIRYPDWQIGILIEQHLWPQRDSNPEEWRPTRVLFQEIVRASVERGDITAEKGEWLWSEVQKHSAQNDPYWNSTEDSRTINS